MNKVSGHNKIKLVVGLVSLIAVLGIGFSYAYSSINYWTMTPSDCFAQQTSSHIIFFSTVGYLNPWNYAELILDVRPVINIKSDVKISGGIGTSNDPFIIDTNN